MDLLGDHVSYILLVIFGLFAVGVHAYSSFGQQIPGDTQHKANALIESLSVVSLSGQYSALRGFIFYLLVSESLYIILTSSSMILQLTLNAIGREEMAGALSGGVELNPLIPILASSVIISASQLKPLSQVEKSIRRIGHRIAGIPRNVYEIQERIKSLPLSAMPSPVVKPASGEPSSSGIDSTMANMAYQARQEAGAMISAIRHLELRRTQLRHFDKSLENIHLLHRLSTLSTLGIESLVEQVEKTQDRVQDYLEQLSQLQQRTPAKPQTPSAQIRQDWMACIRLGYEIESEAISGLCNLLASACDIEPTALSLKERAQRANARILSLLQTRERSSTTPFEREAIIQILANVYLMQDLVTRLDVSHCRNHREQIQRHCNDMASRMRAFERMIDTLNSDQDAANEALRDSEWEEFFARCQNLESDYISVLLAVFADKLKDLDNQRFRASSRIASYAENKADRFVSAGARLDLSTFRLDGFRRSLEKVFCLYEWTLGSDGSQIWATQNTQQIIQMFESIKHKFDAFENDLNGLLVELEQGDRDFNKSSVKARWKDAIRLCSSLEDDLTLLLALLLINKPDVQLGNYALLDDLREQVLERSNNHEMNALGMSALAGTFLSLTLLTGYFILVDQLKLQLRTDSTPAISGYEISGLGPVHKDYLVQHNSLRDQVNQLLSGDGLAETQRAGFESGMLDTIHTLADAFLGSCLEVLDFLIIFGVASTVALAMRSMRRLERRWSSRSRERPPPMYAYLFVGSVAYVLSASLILIYRFIRIVLIPSSQADTDLLSSAHLSVFTDAFPEYLLLPLTAFVVVWFVLEYMDHEERHWHRAINPAFRFALLCMLFNLLGKMMSDAFSSGWDIVNFTLLPTLGFFAFFLMFVVSMNRYHVLTSAHATEQESRLSRFFEARRYGSDYWQKQGLRGFRRARERQKQREETIS